MEIELQQQGHFPSLSPTNAAPACIFKRVLRLFPHCCLHLPKEELQPQAAFSNSNYDNAFSGNWMQGGTISDIPIYLPNNITMNAAAFQNAHFFALSYGILDP